MVATALHARAQRSGIGFAFSPTSSGEGGWLGAGSGKCQPNGFQPIRNSNSSSASSTDCERGASYTGHLTEPGSTMSRSGGSYMASSSSKAKGDSAGLAFAHPNPTNEARAIANPRKRANLCMRSSLHDSRTEIKSEIASGEGKRGKICRRSDREHDHCAALRFDRHKNCRTETVKYRLTATSAMDSIAASSHNAVSRSLLCLGIPLGQGSWEHSCVVDVLVLRIRNNTDRDQQCEKLDI